MGRHARTVRWADMEPTTRSVVAAFSGRVGPAIGDLGDDAFTASLTEGFSDFRSDDVRAKLGQAGLHEIRADILGKLRSPADADTAVVAGLLATMNELAGNRHGSQQYWGQDVHRTILEGPAEDAEAALRHMTGIVAGYIEPHYR